MLHFFLKRCQNCNQLRQRLRYSVFTESTQAGMYRQTQGKHLTDFSDEEYQSIHGRHNHERGNRSDGNQLASPPLNLSYH